MPASKTKSPTTPSPRTNNPNHTPCGREGEGSTGAAVRPPSPGDRATRSSSRSSKLAMAKLRSSELAERLAQRMAVAVGARERRCHLFVLRHVVADLKLAFDRHSLEL